MTLRHLLTAILSPLLIASCLAPAAAQTLEQRLAAIESRVEAVEVRVDTIMPRPAVEAIEVHAEEFKAVHFDSGVRTPQRVAWSIDGKHREGFNAAFVPTRVGQVVTVAADDGTRKAWVIASLKPANLRDVPAGADLKPLLVKGARLRLAAGEYTLSDAADAIDVVIVGAGMDRTTISWTGEDFFPDRDGKPTAITRAAILPAKSAFHGVTFDSTRRYVVGDPTERKKRPDLFQVRDDVTIVDVRAVDWNTVFNTNAKPSRYFVQGSTAVRVRSYFVWSEGTDGVLYDNTVDNSIFEHPIRVSGAQRLAIDGNTLAEIDRRDVDPLDSPKGALTVQWGSHVYRHDNRLTGASSIGPLGVAANGRGDVRSSNYVIANDRVTQPVELWPGLENALIVSTPARIMEQRGAEERRVADVTLIDCPPVAVPAHADRIVQTSGRAAR